MAFSVAVKHYLRGEEGIYYNDLYRLVKFLPPYALPPTIPSAVDVSDHVLPPSHPDQIAGANGEALYHSSSKLERFASVTSGLSQRHDSSTSTPHLPFPVSSPSKKPSFLQPPPTPRSQRQRSTSEKAHSTSGVSDEDILLPARMPPKYSYFDLFPFSLLVRFLTNEGKHVKGRKAARLRAKKRTTDSQNLPLEISLYLVSSGLSHLPYKFTDMLFARALMWLLCNPEKWLMSQQRVCCHV